MPRGLIHVSILTIALMYYGSALLMPATVKTLGLTVAALERIVQSRIETAGGRQ